MTITNAQFDRLPKYAQAEIRQLRREVANRDTVIASITGAEPTGVYVEHGMSMDRTTQYLDARSGVRFRVGAQGEIVVRATRENGQDTLNIMAVGHPSRLSIVPQVANVVSIGLHGDTSEFTLPTEEA